ncbi:hypothetical protein CEXT_637391 [Caerostris extrusa]|uniref:Uncharacterized protein n=1 Tax=Caerostris extrusa TaxID=172846 RepID=A0AAV4N4U3_CAEEX|nr:hypothetical protein CEXT_637391 [Caerostris extrusa]
MKKKRKVPRQSSTLLSTRFRILFSPGNKISREMKDSVDREEYLFDSGQCICSCKGDGRGKTIFESCTKECQEIGRGKATSRRMRTGEMDSLGNRTQAKCKFLFEYILTAQVAFLWTAVL